MEARLGHLYARFKSALDDLCRVSARTLKANIACVIQCNEKRARVLGATGTAVQELSGNTEFPVLTPSQIHVFKDLQKEAWFRLNGLASIAATVGRLLIVKLDVQFEETIYLVVFDPGKTQLKDTASLASVSEVARIAAAFVNQAIILSKLQEGQSPAKEVSLGFNEGRQAAPEALQQVDLPQHPLVTFLMHSLLVKRSLRTRKGFAYVSLRSWRSTAKEAQLDAWKALGIDSTSVAIRPIADEIAAEIRNLYVGVKFEAVICVPYASSQDSRCLSERLAQEIAIVLDLKYVAALRLKQRKGVSSISKNTRLVEFEVSHPVKGPVLLIDDVSTSGVRMEKAMSALRQGGCFPFGIAWIGS